MGYGKLLSARFLALLIAFFTVKSVSKAALRDELNEKKF